MAFVPPAAANPFKGLTSAVANARLARAIRSVLADNERRIETELRLDLPLTLWNQFTTPQHLVALLCCAALFAAYAHGVDAVGGHATQHYIIVCAVLFLFNVFLNVCLACLRLRHLCWEVHSRVATAVLEFERSYGVFRPSQSTNPQASVAMQQQQQQAEAVFVDGVVVQAGPSWRALDFHDPAKTMHTVPVYRDGEWVRLPVLLLVRGDLIALMSGEPAPAKGRCVDAGGAGRRSSMSAVYRIAASRAAAGVAGGDGARVRRARASSSRHGGASEKAEASTAPTGEQHSRGVSVATSGPAPTGALPHRKRGYNSATPGGRRAGEDGGSALARQRNVEVLTLCGDMRRYCLDDTPAAVSLRKRLRTPHRPQPLFLGQLRSMGRLWLWWQVAICALAVAAVVVRSALTPSAAPDVQISAVAAASRPLVGTLSGVLLQLPTALLCASPLSFSVLLGCCELICTAFILAAYELALLRSRWKSWKKALTLRVLAKEKSLVVNSQGLSATTCAAEAASVAECMRTEASKPRQHAAWNPFASRSLRRRDGEVPGSTQPSTASQSPVWPDVSSWLRLLSRSSPNPASHGRGVSGQCSSNIPVEMHHGGSSSGTSNPEAPGAALLPFIVEGDAGSTVGQDEVAMQRPELLLRAASLNSPSGPSSGVSGINASNSILNAQRLAAERRIELAGGRHGSLASELVDAAQASDQSFDAVGGVTMRGELVPRAYADVDRIGEPALLLSDLQGSASTDRIVLPKHVGVLSRLSNCCLRSRSPVLSRRFDGLTFSQITAHWRGPPSSRVWFYFARLFCRPITRLIGMSSVHKKQNAPPGSSKQSAQPHLHLTEHEEQRWSNDILLDSLVDVGFGMHPVPTPLASAQVLLRLGSSTVFCCADRR
jgi:hypothetical protein